MKAAYLLRPAGRRSEESTVRKDFVKRRWRSLGSQGVTLTRKNSELPTCHKTAPLPGEESHFLGQPSFCFVLRRQLTEDIFLRGLGAGATEKISAKLQLLKTWVCDEILTNRCPLPNAGRVGAIMTGANPSSGLY